MAKHLIEDVVRGGAAWRSGIRKGDKLCKLQNEDIRDQIDYQALSEGGHIDVLVEKSDGRLLNLPIIKSDSEALGLKFGKSMELRPKRCANKCIFCFIDQMPKGLRDSLYVKDDDWRFSLMMGNYVTLTNIGEREFQRIIDRKASPLYISVQATDPDVRSFMLGNPSAALLKERLNRLIENGISFHAQIVACPNINDGDILKKSLEDLIAMHPAVLSVAIVPIGLTKFREALYPLRPFDKEESCQVLDMVKPYQEYCLKNFGSSLIFCADEWYVQAKRDVPSHEHYEDYPQIENGIGMLRQLEHQIRLIADLDDTLKEDKRRKKSLFIPAKNVLIATGVAAHDFLKIILKQYKPYSLNIDFLKIINHAFGETVTVAALITGGDLKEQLLSQDLSSYDEIWISESMLRVRDPMFLDGLTLQDVQKDISKPIITIGCHGENLYDAMWQN